MAKKKKQTIGYKYFASGHFVLCHGPIDAITKITFQDKVAYLKEETTNKTIYLDKPNLFGGDEQQGGVQGKLELLFGRNDQQKNSTLQKICSRITNSFNGLISAWRGVTSVVFDNVYIGTSPSMPDSKWRVRRIHTRHDGKPQWYDEKSEILPPPSPNDPAYNFSILSWEIVGANGADGSSSVPVGNFGTSSFVINSPTIPQNEIFEISLAVTASTEFRDVVGGEQVGPYSWIKKGGVYGESTAYNRYMIQISDPPETYYFNHGISQQNYNDSERFALIKIKVRNGATVTCICDPVDNKMARGAKLGFYQYMRFDAASVVDRDINPAHIIRECLTNPIWGVGVFESQPNEVSFRKAADTLYNEKMGMSIKWTDSTPIQEFINNVLDHINGELYLDRITNKWELILIRDDYNKDELIHLDESNISNLEYERRTLAECINSITVTYWDRERGKNSTVPVQDIARIAQQGGKVAQSIEYKGFTNSSLASRVAYRDLKTLSSTLASVSFEVDELISDTWHNGMVFKLSDKSYGLEESVMRITSIKRGDGLSNKVNIEAVEDSFSSPMHSVVEYIPPITIGDNQAKNAISVAFEVPYIELVEQYGEDNVDQKLSDYPDVGYVGIASIRPNNNHINASLFVNAGAGYDERVVIDFCPNAELKHEIDYVQETFELTNVSEFALLEVNQRIQLGEEVMAFVGFDQVSSTITVKRGCFDTVAEKHTSGSKLFGWDNYSGIDDIEYLGGEVVALKALTLTGSDILDINQATTYEVNLNSRAIKPYPPANVKINDQYYPQEIETDLVLTWVDRNRLHQTGGEPLGYFDDGISPEIGTLYQLVLIERDENEIELRTQNLSLGSVNTYTFATSAMDVNTRTIQIILRSLRDGYESYQSFNYTVELSQFFSAPYDLTVEFKND